MVLVWICSAVFSKGLKMPYTSNDLSRTRRVLLDISIVDEVHIETKNVGELVYVLYRIAQAYAQSNSSPRFQDWFEAWGALKIGGTELYRRKIAPYEDGKIEKNGDVL